MPAEANILVVARDASFRRSLAFVLEAEGYRVDVAERLPSIEALSGRYDCIVLDHRSIAMGLDGRSVLAALGTPMILLASRLQEMVEQGFERVVEKPLLGQTLVEAVRAALAKEDPQDLTTQRH